MKWVIQNWLFPAALFVALVLVVVNNARAADGDYAGPRGFHTIFRPLSTETALQESGWQALNLVDLAQTVKIARNPAQYQEVGQVGIFTGPHPSEAQAIGYVVAFAVVHYGVTRGLENLINENPDYRVLQRVWQYVGGAYKAGLVINNRNIGL